MPTRYDWLFILTWTAIIAAAIVAVVVAFWLIQRALLAVWPWVSANSDALVSAALVGLLVVLATRVLAVRR